jgi:hypothetical protein
MIFAMLIRSWLLLFPLGPVVGLPDEHPWLGRDPGTTIGGSAAISILASGLSISILIPLSCSCC